MSFNVKRIMLHKYLIIHLFFFSVITFNAGGYSQEKIKDFYLSNFKTNGSPDWEVKGKEAVVSDKYVDIENMNAKYYSKDDTIYVKSDKAKLNKENMDVRLEKNVKIENEEGMELTTESLDWKRSENKIDSRDWVQANNNSMEIKAKGLYGDTQFKKIDFEKDVQVKIPDEKSGNFTTISCEGPLEIEYNLGKAVFNKNVVVEHKDGKLFSDTAIVFFDIEQKKMVKIVAEGNIKIVRDDNVTVAQRATYFGDTGKIVLEGSPRLIYFPEER